jgi:hypothetical protein
VAVRQSVRPASFCAVTLLPDPMLKQLRYGQRLTAQWPAGFPQPLL